MCLDPATGAAIMAGTAVAGGLVAGAGALNQAKAQSDEYKARSLYEGRQAMLERLKGSYEAKRLKEKGERTFATQRAAFAEAGVRLEGSPTDVIVDSRVENELDVGAVLWGQNVAAQNYEYQAKIDQMNSKQAKKSGVFAALAPVLQGFSTLGGAYT